MLCVAPLQLGDDAQRLRIMVEAAMGVHRRFQHVLAGVAETGVAKVVRQRQSLREIVVELERARQCAGDLRDLDRVGQPRAVMVALVRHEDLAFVGEAPKRGRMDDAVAVALELGPRRRWRLGEQSPAARQRVCGIGCALNGHASGHISSLPARQGAKSDMSDTLSRPDTTDATPVVTERAAQRVKKILAREPEGSLLRVSVNGGGCSGFQYAFDIVQSRADDDLLIERDGVGVLIDPVSLDFLRGAKIDFVDDLMGQAFRIDNPNASSSCGCGTSFSV